MRVPPTMALLLLLLVFARADAATLLTIEWVPYSGATKYDVEKSTDVGVTWTLAVSVKTTACTTTKCSVTYTAPATGLVLFRIVTYNAQGKTPRTSSGFWFNGGWQLPGAVGGAEIVGIQ